MTFDYNVPNASQSPGLLPAQNSTNFSRLKTIINADHVFNDTGQATDGYHKQCTMVNVSAFPTHPLPSGAGAILYSKLDSSSKAQLYFDNGSSNYQITPTQSFIFGTVNIQSVNTSYVISAIPADVYGEIFLYNGTTIQQGNFSSSASRVEGYSIPLNTSIVSETSFRVLLNLIFGPSATNLNLKVSTTNTTYLGVWSYRIFYRFK